MGTKEHRSFSQEFKSDAVRRAEAGGHSLTHIARELGIHPSLLQVWRRKFGSAAAADGATTKPIVSIEDENRQLRRENAALREDREILKKAAAFFAKESR
jgi:transposase